MRIFITSAEQAKAKNGSSYLRVRYVEDTKTSRTAVLFDTDKKPEELSGKVCESVITRGEPSDKIEKIDVIEGADITPFIKTTSLDTKALMVDLKEWTRGKDVDPILTKIVDQALFMAAGRADRFVEWPAASSNHHAFRGGLVEHTWAMAKMAKAVMECDPALKGLNYGVVMTSIVLHDMAKMFTYDFQNGKGEKNNFDVMLGHLAIADEVVVKVCVAEKVPTTSGVVLNLRHCILSHHGKKEWGSPIFPATREAILVHQLDMMQAKNQMGLESIEGIEKGKRSPYIKPLDTEIVNV